MRWLRGCLWLILGLLVLAGGAQVGYVPARRLVVVSGDGAPQRDFLAVYHYEANRWNLVDTIVYRRPGGILRAGADGELFIPGRWYRKGIFDRYAAPRLDLLYVPERHFARAITHQGNPDPAHPFELGSDGRLAVADLGDDPLAWERSVGELHTMLYTLLQLRKLPSDSLPADAAAAAPELAAAVRSEYAQLLARHRATPRRPPPEDTYLLTRPAPQQAAIRAQIAEELVRLPTWGDYLPATWSSRLEQLDGL